MNDQIESIKYEILNTPTNSNGRRVYSEDFKARVRVLKDEGMSLKAIAEAIGIHITTLYCWFPKVNKAHRGFKEIRVAPIVETHSLVQIHFASGTKVLGLRAADLILILKQELVR